jgi:hypothetical protein
MSRHPSGTVTQRHDEGRGSGVSGSEHIEHEACTSIIIRLAERGPVLREPDTLPRFLDVVKQTYPAAHRRQLEGILNSETGYDTASSRAFVYAEVVPRGSPVLWPILAFAADRASRNLKIRAALFHESPDGSVRSGPVAVGWRFEPPEGPEAPEGPEGAHSYYHAQPISSWDKSERNRLPVYGLINQSQPAFPLIAGGSVSLLAGALVSLYGKTRAVDLLSDSQIRRFLVPVLAKVSPWLEGVSL